MATRSTNKGTALEQPADGGAESLTVGVVVLTMGDRPDELGALLNGVAAQQGPPIDVVVVGNGVPAMPSLPDGVRGLTLSENLGIPAGRNAGVAELDTDIVMFLDDDGALPDSDVARRVREAFHADPRLGIISFRIVDPVSGAVQRRHVPRVRVGDPLRSSAVTTFLGGACAVRRAVIDQVGGLPGEFFYAHEETDLAWRALNAGWEVVYRADIVLHHPATAPSRHALYHRLVARNRVWLARRNLPWPLVPVYLGVWTALTLARTRSATSLRAWLSGFREGWSQSCGPRRPLSWHTVWRMAKLGRPPIV